MKPIQRTKKKEEDEELVEEEQKDEKIVEVRNFNCLQNFQVCGYTKR
jgi:hypothetical protein